MDPATAAARLTGQLPSAPERSLDEIERDTLSRLEEQRAYLQSPAGKKAQAAELQAIKLADRRAAGRDRAKKKGRSMVIPWAYAPTPRAVLRANISAYAKVAGAVLADALVVNSKSNEELAIQMSDRELAERMGVSRATASKAIAELVNEEVGLVVKRAGTGHGRNRYTFTEKCYPSLS